MFAVRDIHRFSRDEKGTTAVEYAVMLALVLLALIVAITAVGSSTSSIWGHDAGTIDYRPERRETGGGLTADH